MKLLLQPLALLLAVPLAVASQGSASTPWAETSPECAFPPKSYITEVFTAMTNGSAALFYAHVVDDVSWRVMGTHPLAGHYSTLEAFYNSTTIRLSKIQQPGGTTALVRVVGGCDEEWSMEEMLGDATMNNGMRFNNQYSWATRWNTEGNIVEVRAYVDSAQVAAVITQNEPTTANNFETERTKIYDGAY